jgi:hypothetical protein
MSTNLEQIEIGVSYLGFSVENGNYHGRPQTMRVPRPETYAELHQVITSDSRQPAVLIDEFGRLKGCQMFVNGRLVRNLLQRLPTNLAVRDVRYLKAISGG